ncbi:MAG: DUF3558 family protein [Thermocrispum sp.]
MTSVRFNTNGRGIGSSVIIGLMAALAACDATPASPKTPTSTQKAIVIEQPLDLSAYKKRRTCWLLGESQVAELALPEVQMPSLSSCTWRKRGRPDTGDGYIDIFLLSVHSSTIPYQVHEPRGSTGLVPWKAEVVEGYPAARQSMTDGRVDEEICMFEVGVGNEQAFAIHDNGGGDRAAAVGAETARKDPCARARMAATFIIENLNDQP